MTPHPGGAHGPLERGISGCPGVLLLVFVLGDSQQAPSASQSIPGLAKQDRFGGKELPITGDVQAPTFPLCRPPSSSPAGARPDPAALLRSMASAFARVVRSVVQELDHGGELTPVDSLQSSTSFQLYCLLGRKSSSSRFWKHRYTRVNLSIRDILEPDAPEPGIPHLALSEPWVGSGEEGAGPLPPALGLWAPASRGQALFRGPSARGERRRMVGWASALVLLQLWSVATPSISTMLWMGRCRAAWSWRPQDRGSCQAGPRCPAAPAPR